jgi:hypothetical protein
MSKKAEEIPNNDSSGREKSGEIDRVMKEAYNLMYERQRLARDGQNELREESKVLDFDLKGEMLKEKIVRLKELGAEGQLGKLNDSLEDPLLTKYPRRV